MMRLMNDYIKYWASSGINVDLKVLERIFDDPASA